MEEVLLCISLFGNDFNDYDEIFSEKLNLLLNIRDNEIVNWSGRFRPKLENQKFTQEGFKKLPIWLGVGGTPQSFIRAGKLGLPLMIAIIGGEVKGLNHLLIYIEKHICPQDMI